MERVKKRKLKFPCLVGDNDETPRRRSVQSCYPANRTMEQSLLKFEVGKSTKQRNGNRMKKLFTKGFSNGISLKNRSPSILVKLMRRGRRSYKTVVLKQKTSIFSNVDHSCDQCSKNTQHFGSVTKCKCRDDMETLPEISSQVKEGFESGQVGLHRYDHYVDESLHVLRSGSASEPEEITVSFRIVFDHNDRLTHSFSCMSESSLILEASNRMLERLSKTHIKEDVQAVSMLGEKPSFSGMSTTLGNRSQDGQEDGSTSHQSSFEIPNYERNAAHVDDIDEKLYNEPTNHGKGTEQKDIFNHEEDIPSQYVRFKKKSQTSQKSSWTNCKNEDPAKYQPPVSDIDVDAQLSKPESENDVAFHSDCFERVNYRLQDLKKNVHLLKVGSKLNSNKLSLIPKVKPIGQLSCVLLPESVSRDSAYMAHILQTFQNDVMDTSSPSWKSDATHHPLDPRLLYCLEKYYFDETVLLRNEKRLFYDYIEQMFIRNSKSLVAYPWVNPMKRESQLAKSSFEDRIRNVIVEIGKDEDEDFSTSYIDKDSEWMQWTNEIDNLGKLVADLVLNGLLLEVVDL